jgi:hypothetical protein
MNKQGEAISGAKNRFDTAKLRAAAHLASFGVDNGGRGDKKRV